MMIMNGHVLGGVPGWIDRNDRYIAKFPDQFLVGVLRRVVGHACVGKCLERTLKPHIDALHFRQ